MKPYVFTESPDNIIICVLEIQSEINKILNNKLTLVFYYILFIKKNNVTGMEKNL